MISGGSVLVRRRCNDGARATPAINRSDAEALQGSYARGAGIAAARGRAERQQRRRHTPTAATVSVGIGGSKDCNAFHLRHFLGCIE